MQAANGCQVNGQRVREAVLHHGDQVSIRPYQFVVETKSDDGEWIPAQIINFSTTATRKTIVADADTLSAAVRPVRGIAS